MYSGISFQDRATNKNAGIGNTAVDLLCIMTRLVCQFVGLLFGVGFLN